VFNHNCDTQTNCNHHSATSPHIITRYQQERTNHRPIAEHILRDDIKQEIAVQMDLVFFLSLPTNWFLTRHQNGSQQKH